MHPVADTEASPCPSWPGELPWIAVVVALALWLTLDSVVLPPTLRMDNVSYLAMAEDPAAYFHVAEVHAQRPLPPLLVAALGAAGVSAMDAFRLLSALSLHAFLVLFFLALRGAGVGRPVALGSTIFMAISAWPVPYSLSNVYQACDAMTYPLGLAVVVGTVRRRPGVAVPAALAGVLVRQQLFVLAVGAMVAAYRDTRRRVWLGGLAGIVVLFGAVVATAGGGGGSSLWAHTGARALDLEPLVRGAWETRLPVLLSPFLLLLAVDVRAVMRVAARFWWVTAYALATVLQPLLAFSMTGASNAVRLAMLGLWPLFLLAGIRLDRRWLRRPWARWVFLALPLLYGTEHLVSLETTWPSPVGHRAVVNVLLLALVALAAREGRGDAAGAAERTVPGAPA